MKSTWFWNKSIEIDEKLKQYIESIELINNNKT